MGSRLTTHAYYFMVLEAYHSARSQEIASSDSLATCARSICYLQGCPQIAPRLSFLPKPLCSWPRLCAEQVLDLAERFPTCMDVSQAHILDDAQGTEDVL